MNEHCKAREDKDQLDVEGGDKEEEQEKNTVEHYGIDKILKRRGR